MKSAPIQSFNCSGGVIVDVVSPSDPYRQWRGADMPSGTVFDARGETFHLRHSSNPDPEGVCDYAGPDPVPTNKYPVRPGITQNECLQGGRVIGEVSLTADAYTWASQPSGYCNSAAVFMDSNGSARQIVEGTRIDRVWDGVRFADHVCRTSPGFCSSVMRHVWVSNARDDCVENDVLGGLSIEDSLLDGCFSGISADPGGCSDCPPIHAHTDVIRLDGVLLRLEAFPYTYLSDAKHSLAPFKLRPPYSPLVTVSNSIIAFDYYHSSRFGRWRDGWSSITSCSNNYLLWLSNAPFPSYLGFPMPPTCFKIVTGPSAEAIWKASRNRWIELHPDIARIEGDPVARP